MKRFFAIIFAVGLVMVSMAQNPNTDPKAAKVERAKITAGETSYAATKKAYLAKKTDAKLKAKFVQATVELGTTVMMSPLLSPKEKYPRALRLYREALQLDPKNKEALNNKKLIENIYQQMGRPVPK